MELSRRAFGLGAMGIAGLAVLGAVPIAWTRVDEDAVITAAVGAFFPPVGGLPSAARVGVAENLARYLDAVPTRTKLEVQGLLRAIEMAPLPRHGRVFTHLEPDARTVFLQELAGSEWATARLIVGALRQVCAIAYWQSPLTWESIGYDGPWVGR